MFTAQKAFVAEWGYGTSSMTQHGYDSDGTSLYNVGFQKTVGTGSFNATTSSSGYSGPPVRSYKSSTQHIAGGATARRPGLKQIIP